MCKGARVGVRSGGKGVWGMVTGGMGKDYGWSYAWDYDSGSSSARSMVATVLRYVARVRVVWSRPEYSSASYPL